MSRPHAGAQRAARPAQAANLVRSAIAAGHARAQPLSPMPAASRSVGKIAFGATQGQPQAKNAVRSARSRAAKKPSRPAMRGSDRARWHGNVRRSPSGVKRTRRCRRSPPASIGHAAERPARARATPRSAARLPPAPASRRNRRSCRPAWPARPRGRAGAAAGRRARDVGLALQPGDVGMAADRAGGRAGRIEQHGVERPGLPFGRRRRRPSRPPGRAARDFRARASSRFAERSTAVTRAPACGKLRGLAARRGAEVGDRFAGDIAEQPGRQRGGGVLHPPGALVDSRAAARPGPARRCAPCRSAARARAGAAPSSRRRTSP